MKKKTRNNNPARVINPENVQQYFHRQFIKTSRKKVRTCHEGDGSTQGDDNACNQQSTTGGHVGVETRGHPSHDPTIQGPDAESKNSADDMNSDDVGFLPMQKALVASTTALFASYWL